jgi:hypothetical protein
MVEESAETLDQYYDSHDDAQHLIKLSSAPECTRKSDVSEIASDLIVGQDSMITLPTNQENLLLRMISLSAFKDEKGVIVSATAATQGVIFWCLVVWAHSYRGDFPLTDSPAKALRWPVPGRRNPGDVPCRRPWHR